MYIQGFYYLKNASKKHAAEFQCDDAVCSVSIDQGIVNTAPVVELKVSDRIGSTPRQIRFEDGSMFETNANDEVDVLLQIHQNLRLPKLLHTLESKGTFIPLLLILAAFTGWGTYVWGLPKAAQVIAFSLPASELGIIGDHTLQALDKTYLQPSQLAQEIQTKIQFRFQNLTSKIGSGFNYRLHFRRLPNNMPNAFALPDGSIVLMDGLVELADHPWEVDSVLLHEIAHVEQRHGLQMAFQDTLITLMFSLMLGDTVSTGDAVLSLPILLVENKYSQNFEQSSDDFASDYMLKNNVNNHYFAIILGKLAQAGNNTNTDNNKQENTEDSIWNNFSSHPQMEKRILRIEEKVIRKP